MHIYSNETLIDVVLMLCRSKRRIMDYPSRGRNQLSDDMTSPYAIDKNYENNPFDGMYEGLRNEDDGMMRNNNEDTIDDGIWYNSVERPHFELPGSKRAYKIEKIGKRFKPNQQRASDEWKNFDFKKYFYY